MSPLRGPGCARSAILDCPGGYERDPLAKPFVRSSAVAIASAVVTNLLVRRVIPHQACNVARLEVLAVANNLGVLRR
jgi:hypothetical protein